MFRSKRNVGVQDLATRALGWDGSSATHECTRICRVTPIHTADVERTFSQLKLVKTRVRNSLLRIAIEGPPVGEFPVTEAVKLWATKKNRRMDKHS